MDFELDQIIAKVEAAKIKAGELGKKNTKLIHALDEEAARLDKARRLVEETPSPGRSFCEQSWAVVSSLDVLYFQRSV